MHLSLAWLPTNYHHTFAAEQSYGAQWVLLVYDLPVLLFLLVCFEAYEELDEGFGVVEIVETDERDEPLTGTAGIE
jgi:hypothetical protein